jgi:hypothetical protein
MLVGHTHSFLGTLSFETLQRCRDIVKRTHMRFYPKALITDREADRIIEAQGPKCWEAAQRMVIASRLAR